MKPSTEKKLIEAIEQCVNEDRSPEYKIQFLQDYAKVGFDCAITFYCNWLDKETEAMIEKLKNNKK